MIRFSGEKERSGWDWADLLLKVSVPVLILGLSTAYSIISADRQEKISIEQRESQAVASFIKDLQPLLIEKGLGSSAPGSEVRGVARGLTLAVLSQVEDAQRKRLIIRFLFDSGLNAKLGNLIDLSEANLRGVNLRGANLRGAKLGGANLSGAFLRGAILSGADLSQANLRGAILSGADLSGADFWMADLSGAYLNGSKLNGADLRAADLSRADLSWAKLNGADLSVANFSGATFFGINWDVQTQWPSGSRFQGARNIPEALKKQLKL
ncbi:pentapeptide repeat-containing protein [Cyanobium sp. FGCU-6]|nr:pentapeptide repeat-containing protein [Cyanobium sp. FGCU6]